MDIHIGEVNSKVSTSDSESLLLPRVLEQIVAKVMERLHEEQGRQAQADQDRRMSTGVFDTEV